MCRHKSTVVTNLIGFGTLLLEMQKNGFLDCIFSIFRLRLILNWHCKFIFKNPVDKNIIYKHCMLLKCYVWTVNFPISTISYAKDLVHRHLFKTHLVKGHANFCDHLTSILCLFSIVCHLFLAFHIFFISTENHCLFGIKLFRNSSFHSDWLRNLVLRTNFKNICPLKPIEQIINDCSPYRIFSLVPI